MEEIAVQGGRGSGVRVIREGRHLQQHHRVVARRDLGVHPRLEPERGAPDQQGVVRAAVHVETGEAVALAGGQLAAQRRLVRREQGDADRPSPAQARPCLLYTSPSPRD